MSYRSQVKEREIHLTRAKQWVYTVSVKEFRVSSRQGISKQHRHQHLVALASRCIAQHSTTTAVLEFRWQQLPTLREQMQHLLVCYAVTLNVQQPENQGSVPRSHTHFPLFHNAQTGPGVHPAIYGFYNRDRVCLLRGTFCPQCIYVLCGLRTNSDYFTVQH